MQVMSMVTPRGGVAKNQYVIDNGGTLDFQSYTSHCASYNKATKTLTLFENWDYGNTTMRYLLQYLRDFLGMEIKGCTELRKKAIIDGVKIEFFGQEQVQEVA